MVEAANGANEQVTLVDERALIISSDGHCVAPMSDYRSYMPAAYHEEFDAFLEVFAREGFRAADADSLRNRLEPEFVAEWVENVIKPGRLGGQTDPHLRKEQLDREGIAAEVLFPDFGLPFELHPPLKSALIGATRTPEQVEVANKAHNRWMADYCAAAPERFGGQAVVSFADVDDTVAEIRWAKDHGLVGIVLPVLDESTPFFHPRHEPIWNVLEELEMPANSHTSLSAVTPHMAFGTVMAAPNPACAIPLMGGYSFHFAHEILTHFVWGGIFERHPQLHLAMTEQGTGWVITAIRNMDYSWEHSYLQRTVREVVKHKPSEYCERQLHMGSSLLSRAEIEARHAIGVNKMMIGMDYPHHEGVWHGPGTTEFLRATLGAAGVPADEARLMLGGNAAKLWGFDTDSLRNLADRIGPRLQTVLTPPTEDLFPRGDVHKPLASFV